MKTLLLLRHAKSSWEDENLADHDRPLNKRGKGDAPRMGELIANVDQTPQLIISSSAKRAVQTAKLVAENCGYEDEIVFSRQLYAAGPEEFLFVLHGLKAAYDRIMVVGHNPGLEELVEALTGEWVRMPTAAIAQIEFSINDWSKLDLDGSGVLVDVWMPRELT